MCFDHRHDEEHYRRHQRRRAHEDARKRVRERVDANNRSSPRAPAGTGTGKPWPITLLIAGLFAAGVGLPPARLLGLWQPPACALAPAERIGQTLLNLSTGLSFTVAFASLLGLLLCGLILFVGSNERMAGRAKSWAYSCCIALAAGIGTSQAALFMYSLSCSPAAAGAS